MKEVDVQLYQSGGPLRLILVPQFLYQRGYVVEPQKGIITCQIMEKGEKPISPRCSKCYDKAVKKVKNED